MKWQIGNATTSQHPRVRVLMGIYTILPAEMCICSNDFEIFKEDIDDDAKRTIIKYAKNTVNYNAMQRNVLFHIHRCKTTTCNVMQADI